MNKIDLTGAMSDLRRYGLQLFFVVTILLSAQQAFSQASSYAFVESTTTWTEITGGTPSTALADDGTEVVSLPMPFVYNGGAVPQVTISTNGFLRLAGGAVFATSWTNDLANTLRTPVVAPFWDDNHLVAGTGTIQYTVTGVAPARKFVVQWKDVTTSGSGSNTVTTKASFQVVLSEGTNVIEIIYGPSDAGVFSGSIGLNSAPGGAGNFLSITPGAPATTSSTIAANSIVAPPASGTVYSFTPPSASTITSAASGLWSDPATWTGGIVPNFASTVTIAGGHSITVDFSPTVASLTVGNGTSFDSVLFNGAAVRSLSVNGGLTIAANAVMTTTPTTGTSARNIFLGGDFINNGAADLSSNGTLLVFAGTAPQVLGGTGAFSNAGTIREIQVNSGLTINIPINVSARFTLADGLLTTNNNLSMDNTLGGVATAGVNFRRSVVTPAINGAVNVGAAAVYNLDYVFFTGQTAVNCTTSTEIPASRTINGIRFSSGVGNHLYVAGGSLTLTSASSSTTNSFPNTATAPGALIFGIGVIQVPTGSELILSNGALANITGGSATAYIQGKLTWTVNSTTAQTRNFRVGNGTDHFLVVLGGLNTAGSAQTFSVELGGAPSGTPVAPVTALMGARTARITSSAALPATATVQLNWTANDGLNLGTLAEVRVVQGTAVNGSWTERSVSTTIGTLAGIGNRTTAAGIDLANGEYFGFGTTAGSQLAVVSVSSPGTQGCYTASETVSAVLQNTGGSLNYTSTNVTIHGRVTGPTGTTTNLTAVVRSSGSVAAGGFDTITFMPTVDFTLQGTHLVEIFIDSITGQSLNGDTLRASVRSTVYNVTVTPSTIIQGDSAVVSVSSPDGIRFSEFTLFYSGTGQTGANYPSFVTSGTADPDLLEISNFSGLTADMSDFQLEIVGAGARNYTFPANTILLPGAVMIVHVGSGTDLPANNFYNTGGTNGTLSSASLSGYILRDPSGFIVDAVGMNGYVFLATTGVTAADWSGPMASASGRAGASLASPDNNSGSAWVIANSPAPLQTIGTLNPGFMVAPASVTWAGPGGFSATGPTVSTGARALIAQDTYTATVTVNGCAKTASGILNVIAPGPPIAGFTVSDTVATTGGVVSTITLTDTSLSVPTSWKWTVTPNNVAFVNNTTDTSKIAQIQFTAPGIYTVQLRASNNGGADSLTYNTPISVSLAYCASNATSTFDTKIDSVIFGNMAAGSAENTCETYTDNTGLGSVVSVVNGGSFPLAVKSGYCGTSAYQSYGSVFVDLNQNGIFEFNESVMSFGPLAATGSGVAREWFTGQVSIPSSALPGQTRLRVIWREGVSSSAAITGCGTYTYGETEDYNITITQADLSSTQLLVPSNQTFFRVAGNATAEVQASWTPAVSALGTPITYTFELANSSTGFAQPLFTRLSDNGGAATTATFTYQELDQILANAGVQPDQTFNGFWNVKAVSGVFSSNATIPFSLNLQRGVVGSTLARYAPQQNGGTTQVRGPNGLNTNKNMHAAMIVPAREFSNAGIMPGDALYDVHFTVNNGNDIPVRGFMEFWIQPTNDSTYNKGTSWSTIPGSMIQVFADSVTLPTGNTATTFPLVFPNAINYNGQSMYVAYKFSSNLALATIPLVYRANTSIPNSLASAAGNASAPDAMALTSFRPELGWGKERLWYDLEMRALYTYSHNLQNNGVETAVVAIRNNGALQDSMATLQIMSGGANPFSNTYSLPTLNQDQTFYFNLPVLGTTNSGLDQVMASLSADFNQNNNNQVKSRQVAAGLQSHNSATQAAGNWGFNLGAGVLYSRYFLSTPQQLAGASVLMGLDPNTAGRELFVQVVDSLGNVLGTSVPSIVTSQELGQRKQFTFAQPIPLGVGSYFIGLAQPASTNSLGYFPAGVVPEPLPRIATYYFGPIGAGVPSTNTNLYNAGLVTVLDAQFASLLPPVANFTQSDYTAFMGGQSTTITFNDISTENPNGWSWTIEHIDPNVNMTTAYNVVSGSLTGPQLGLSFNVPGIYNVTLAVANGVGGNSLFRASALIVYEEACVSGAMNSGDTKIEAFEFATISTSSSPTACERYTSYLGLNPVIGGTPTRGLGILRFNFQGSKTLYAFGGNMIQNGWGSSYDALPLRAAVPFLTTSQAGDNLNCTPPTNGALLSGNIAVIYRGACEFGLKAYEAQQAGAVGVIIINNVPGIPTNLAPGAWGGLVTIPVALINAIDGAALVNAMTNTPGFTVEMGGAGPQVGQAFLGQTLPINIKPGSCSGTHYTAYGKVWIDFNGDHQFDSTEMVFGFPSNSSFNWVSGQVTIPMSATPGLRRMRIVYAEQMASNVQPCGTYGWGETEDYLMEISASFAGIIATLPVVDACAGPVRIPVTATNFNNVGAISMSILFNQSNLSFVGISGINPALAGGQVLSNAVNGRLGISWFDVNGATSMNDTLFYLDFIGSGFSNLIWDQTPGSNEFSDNLGNLKMQFFNNGSYAVITNCNEIVGVLQYGNLSGTPLNNSSITLFNQNGPIQAVITDAAGNFSFTGLPNGVYQLEANTSKPWGGVNATDALGVARHFTNAAPLVGIRMMAADVNGNQSINSTDALLVARRFTGQIGSFLVGDWVFERPIISAQGGVTNLNIKGLTYGDVNASYTPAQTRIAPLIQLDSREVVYVGNESTVVPVVIDRNLSIGALSLELRLPLGVEVLGVKSALGIGEFQYQVIDGVLRIGWFSLSDVSLQANDPVFELELKTTGMVVGEWTAEGLSEMANAWAEAYPEAGLRLPRVVRSLAGAFAASVYPNPTQDVSQLQVQLPEAGKLSIRITDALGRVVYELNGKPTAAGTQVFEVDAKVWSSGVYHATVQFENEQMSEQLQLKIQKIK